MASKEATVMKGKHISEPSYGYKMIRKIDPKNQRRTIGYRAPNEEESPTLKRIFRERVLEGKSYRQIAFGLNQNEIKTRKGEYWSGSRISQVLRNPFPCGYIAWHKTENRKYGDEKMIKVIPEENWKLIPVNEKLEKYYKLIISKDLYRKAQEIRKRNRQIKGRGTSSINNILSGLIKCPICGAPMVETGIYETKKPPYKKGFYQCHMWSNKRLCSSVRYPSWSVNKKVLEKVKTFLNDPLAFEEYLKENGVDEIQKKEEELKSCEQKLKKGQKKIEFLNLKYLDGKIKDEYYADLLNKLEKDIEGSKEKFLTLKEETQSFRQEKIGKKSLKVLSEEIKDRFENLEPQQIKLILNILIKKVVPSKEMKGRGVKGDPRENNPTIIWKNPAIMEQECAYRKQR
jgi:site-specific DNA recombinase